MSLLIFMFRALAKNEIYDFIPLDDRAICLAGRNCEAISPQWHYTARNLRTFKLSIDSPSTNII